MNIYEFVSFLLFLEIARHKQDTLVMYLHTQYTTTDNLCMNKVPIIGNTDKDTKSIYHKYIPTKETLISFLFTTELFDLSHDI